MQEDVAPLPFSTDGGSFVNLDDNDLNASASSFDFTKFIDQGFAPNHGENEYTLFGIRESQVVKIVYEFQQNADLEYEVI